VWPTRNNQEETLSTLYRLNGVAEYWSIIGERWGCRPGWGTLLRVFAHLLCAAGLLLVPGQAWWHLRSNPFHHLREGNGEMDCGLELAT